MSALTRFVGALMVVSFCAGLEVKTARGQFTPDQVNAMIAAMDMQTDVAEARKWLPDEKAHLIGPTSKMKRADIKKLVDDLYAAGALKVYFVGIVKEGATESSQLLTVVLPPTGPSRAKIGAVMDAFYKAYLPTVGLTELFEGIKFMEMLQPVHPVNLGF